MAATGAMRIFKYCCLGCVGTVFLALITFAAIGWIGSNRAEFTDAEASYDLARLVPAATADPLEATDPPTAESAPPVNRVHVVVEGIDEVTLRRCAPGEGLTIEATYNKNRIDYTESLTERDDGSWEYSVEMTGGGSYFVQLLEKIFSDHESKLDLCLPADAPIALTAEMSKGGVEAELGGLWLTTIELTLDSGGGIFSFDSPLREPAESLTFHANMGGGVIAGIGNASPARIEFDSRMAGFMADFSGDWRTDAEIRITGSMSGVTLVIPRELRLEGLPADLAQTGTAAETAPTIRFSADSDFEDIEIIRD